MRSILLLLLVLVVPYLANCSEIGVPVLLWRHRDSSGGGLDTLPPTHHRSTVQQIDGSILGEDYLRGAETVVAFVQNRINLEQFTTEEDPEHRMPTVRSLFTDSSIEPTLLVDVIKPTDALKRRNFRYIEDPIDTQINDEPLTVRTGDKVWIDLPDDHLVNNDQLIGELVARIQANVSAKNTVYLITGRTNQFRSIDLEDRDMDIETNEVVDDSKSRRIRRDTIGAAGDDKQRKYLLTVVDDKDPKKECLYFYSNNLEVIIGQFSSAKADQEFSEPAKLDTEAKPGSQCWLIDPKARKQERSGLLALKYEDPKQPDKSVSLRLQIESPHLHPGRSDYWFVSSGNLTYKNIVYTMDFRSVAAETIFSYSCGQLVVWGRTGPTDKTGLILKFSRFQLQPFTGPETVGPRKGYIFTDGYHCETWMTLPLWMGLLTLILLFAILFFGIYFISIVNTPDRFENPKGKPLIISNLDE
ncbi:uncharacterized protein LOC128952041 [Oppia nitens]|uniref:uncharacterized protein LOC128952041 n=1 Tax=Oppia nitens TaxID=1686743 RepID=UPI0023DC6677|nr:uncharacterized protein LOC128952041 [Oppia nitens]